MIIYGYDPATGAYRGQKEARPDPLELQKATASAMKAAVTEARNAKKSFNSKDVVVAPTKFLVPKNFTDVAPPVAQPGQVAVFAADLRGGGLGGSWSLKAAASSAPKPPAPKATMADVRATRDELLAGSDWTQLPDAPLADVERKAWAVYRQALRDLPKAVVDPSAVTWPISPSKAQ